MIITLTLNPAIDKTIEVPNLTLGAVNRITDNYHVEVGGKGINVSKVLKELGSSSKAIGIVGGTNGDIIKKYLEEKHLEYEFVDGKMNTRINLKIVDPESKLTTEINEFGGPYEFEVYEKLKNVMCINIRKGDIVILAGSLPKGADPYYYNQLIALCMEKGAKVYLDIEGELLQKAILLKPHVIKPNLNELESMFHKKFQSKNDIVNAARTILLSGVETVIISMGELGALFAKKDKIISAKGLNVKTKSTVGAGDAMVAAFAYSEERKLSFHEGVKLSIATSAAKVMLEGTTAPTLSQIQDLLAHVILEEDSL